MKNKYVKQAAVVLVTMLAVMQGCKKDDQSSNMGATTNTDSGNGTPFTAKPSDPATAATIGFFLDNWQIKTFTTPISAVADKPTGDAVSTVTVDLTQVITKVPRYMFGNNVNPYMGQLITEPVLLNYISTLAPGIIRAPGGSLSDVYFFNTTDSQKPSDAPLLLQDYQGVSSSAGYWYGKNTASYTCSIDNYYGMLQQTNNTGILTVNYAYARYGTGLHPVQTAAHLAADWVRYDKGRTKYWEVGNENYGNWEAGYRIDISQNHDGQPQILTGDLYGQHFKVFADSMRKAAADVGTTIKIGAIAVDADYSTNPTIIKNWNAGMMPQAGAAADFFVVHRYYAPYNTNAGPDVILPTAVSETKSVMDYVTAQMKAANITQKPVAMTEWNINSVGSKQMVSNIAGLHAVLTIGEFIKNQYGMASRWDLANAWDSGNDHGLFNNPFTSSNTEPNAAAWNPRPAFYYLYFLQKYFGDRMVPTTVSGNANIQSYASSFTSGEAGVVLVNNSATDQVTKVVLNNFDLGTSYYYYTLNGGSDNGSFSAKLYVNGVGPSTASGGPANYNTIYPYSSVIAGGIKVNVPAYGAVFMVVGNKK